ncbi:GNAT family N-acetyltransferase [Pseudoramibacter faecis]|uniref:GNAT family N-acetyltransferase n=1 Tax=Pseudoramibacter faecis TaxID=3108534 RepID=UPI002E76B79E|nr:GNAT family N-acetyltransferase [Pseudoramibacter sp. HA2172]
MLYLQNCENRAELSLEDQPELADIPGHFFPGGGGFWLALDEADDRVVGTIGLMVRGRTGLLKKFFVDPSCRGRRAGVSSALFGRLTARARAESLAQIVLDTPAKARRAHRFYRKMGFRETPRAALPIPYPAPSVPSLFFVLDLPGAEPMP